VLSVCVIAGAEFAGSWAANFFALDRDPTVAAMALVEPLPLFILMNQYSVDHIEISLTPPVERESAFSMCGQFSK
jgi:hypothetical protein